MSGSYEHRLYRLANERLHKQAFVGPLVRSAQGLAMRHPLTTAGLGYTGYKVYDYGSGAADLAGRAYNVVTDPTGFIEDQVGNMRDRAEDAQAQSADDRWHTSFDGNLYAGVNGKARSQDQRYVDNHAELADQGTGYAGKVDVTKLTPEQRQNRAAYFAGQRGGEGTDISKYTQQQRAAFASGGAASSRKDIEQDQASGTDSFVMGIRDQARAQEQQLNDSSKSNWLTRNTLGTLQSGINNAASGGINIVGQAGNQLGFDNVNQNLERSSAQTGLQDAVTGVQQTYGTAAVGAGVGSLASKATTRIGSALSSKVMPSGALRLGTSGAPGGFASKIKPVTNWAGNTLRSGLRQATSTQLNDSVTGAQHLQRIGNVVPGARPLVNAWNAHQPSISLSAARGVQSQVKATGNFQMNNAPKLKPFVNGKTLAASGQGATQYSVAKSKTGPQLQAPKG